MNEEIDMSQTTVRNRAEIPVQYKWNAESVFATTADWQAEAARLKEDITGIEGLRGRLAKSPQDLLAVVTSLEEMMRRVGKLVVYARLLKRSECAARGWACLGGMPARPRS